MTKQDEKASIPLMTTDEQKGLIFSIIADMAEEEPEKDVRILRTCWL